MGLSSVAGWPTLCACCCSIIGTVAVIWHIHTHKNRTKQSSFVTSRCVLWIALCDLLWAIINVCFVDWYSTTHVFRVMCEASTVLCVGLCMLDLAVNSAVGLWTNCLAWWILSSLLWPHGEDVEKAKAQMWVFHCTVFSISSAIAIGGVAWGCATVGCDHSAYDYGHVRILLLVVPKLCSLLIDACVICVAWWRLHTHSTKLNRDRLAWRSCLYLVSILCCWGPYIVDFLRTRWDGQPYRADSADAILLGIRQILMASLGWVHAVIYFFPSVSKGASGIERKYIQFEDADVNDGPGPKDFQARAMELRLQGVLVQRIRDHLPESTAPAQMRAWEGVAECASCYGWEFQDLVGNPDLFKEVLDEVLECSLEKPYRWLLSISKTFLRRTTRWLLSMSKTFLRRTTRCQRAQ